MKKKSSLVLVALVAILGSALTAYFLPDEYFFTVLLFIQTFFLARVFMWKKSLQYLAVLVAALGSVLVACFLPKFLPREICLTVFCVITIVNNAIMLWKSSTKSNSVHL